MSSRDSRHSEWTLRPILWNTTAHHFCAVSPTSKCPKCSKCSMIKMIDLPPDAFTPRHHQASVRMTVRGLTSAETVVDEAGVSNRPTPQSVNWGKARVAQSVHAQHRYPELFSHGVHATFRPSQLVAGGCCIHHHLWCSLLDILSNHWILRVCLAWLP